MQVNQINGPMDTSNFNGYIKKYLSMNNSSLLNDYKIPADRIDIIPEALNLYGFIIRELQSETIEIHSGAYQTVWYARLLKINCERKYNQLITELFIWNGFCRYVHLCL